MVDAICKELQQRNSYIQENVDTIYFGGGTPSILTDDQLLRLLDVTFQTYIVANGAEITLEANPEDLSEKKLRSLKQLGINRLSIGIQTFSDDRLKWMNRIHDSKQAMDSFRTARQVGFHNISLDLIYAVPKIGLEEWLKDLENLTKLEPEHISLYGLTVEERTVFGDRQKKGQLIEVPEEKAAEQYLRSISYLKRQGYRQYEVSNFARSGYESKHNGSYWSGVPYLGVGPGAHSFNKESRRFNIRNNASYLRSIANDSPYFETEYLSQTQHINEHILTGLRTVSGVDLSLLEREYGRNLHDEFGETIQSLARQGLIQVDNQRLSLTVNGFLVADEIALRFFFDE